MVSNYQATAESDQSMYLEMLGMLAETYITVFVAGPLFLITIFIVMGLMGPGNLLNLKVLIYAVIPLSAAAFSILSKRSFPWKRFETGQNIFSIQKDPTLR